MTRLTQILTTALTLGLFAAAVQVVALVVVSMRKR
jgi:hypothetical protein